MGSYWNKSNVYLHWISLASSWFKVNCLDRQMIWISCEILYWQIMFIQTVLLLMMLDECSLETPLDLFDAGMLEFIKERFMWLMNSLSSIRNLKMTRLQELLLIQISQINWLFILKIIVFEYLSMKWNEEKSLESDFDSLVLKINQSW